MKTVFSGIQPSGLVHLGNLLGAINNWVKLSNENSKNYFCIVDLHSLTGLPNKNDLKKSINDTLKVLVASGINTKTSVIYKQSNLQEHAYLSWILSNFCQVGELQRMTQFKEKASSFGTHSGLLTYPILMASDILIHKANEVPVGDDQTQHLELTRNIQPILYIARMNGLFLPLKLRIYMLNISLIQNGVGNRNRCVFTSSRYLTAVRFTIHYT